jgi:hypothetical protein
MRLLFVIALPAARWTETHEALLVLLLRRRAGAVGMHARTNPLQRERHLTRAGVSRATERLPPRVAQRRPLPTMLLRRHIDELRGDVRGTVGL